MVVDVGCKRQGQDLVYIGLGCGKREGKFRDVKSGRIVVLAKIGKVRWRSVLDALNSRRQEYTIRNFLQGAGGVDYELQSKV